MAENKSWADKGQFKVSKDTFNVDTKVLEVLGEIQQVLDANDIKKINEIRKLLLQIINNAKQG